MKKIYIKERKRHKTDFQFFMHDFVDVCREAGFEEKKDLFPSYSWHIRAILRDILIFIYRLIHSNLPFILRRKKSLVITSNGVMESLRLFLCYGMFGLQLGKECIIVLNC